jgi:hypothetical protein
MPFGSDVKCCCPISESLQRGEPPPGRATAAGAALGLIAMAVVALNAPATRATAIPRPSRAFAHAIPHTIKPFRSIGGVRLGFTVAQVDRRFGPPDHRFTVPHHHLAKYIYDDENFEVGFGGVLPRVIWVASYRRQDHIPHGLSVDSSTLAQARRAYPHGLHCSHGACTLYDHGDRSQPHMTFEFSLVGHRLGDIELSVPISRLRQITGPRSWAP